MVAQSSVGTARTGARQALRRERFKAYFPRLFAFACSATGDEAAARDVTVAVFADVFALPEMRDAEFEITLFKAARDACASSHLNDGLSGREREVISLVFDAQLELGKVADVLGMRLEAVPVMLANGLRKLTPAPAPGRSGVTALSGYS